MTAALVSGVLVVVSATLSAVVTQWYTRRNGDHAARREYEYRARTAVFEQMQPVLFQLAERCDDAFQRLSGLAKSAKSGRLDVGNPKHRLRADSHYYLPSTIYRLIAPLVAVRMCETEIGRLDVSLAPALANQYRLAKRLYRSWNSGDALACRGVRLPYDSDGPIELRQHIRLGAIDQIVDLMTTTENGSVRCLRYGEFQQLYNKHAKREPSRPDALCRLKVLLTDFHPQEKPVLWRILLTQAVLCHAIAQAFESASTSPMATPSLDLFETMPRDDFDWTTPNGPQPFDPPTTALAAVREYLEKDPREQERLRTDSISGAALAGI
jgi:hypothetical protein